MSQAESDVSSEMSDDALQQLVSRLVKVGEELEGDDVDADEVRMASFIAQRSCELSSALCCDWFRYEHYSS